MELSKLQLKNLNNVIIKSINYDLTNREDIYFLLMSYKCFMNESDTLINYCIDYVMNTIGLDRGVDIYGI